MQGFASLQVSGFLYKIRRQIYDSTSGCQTFIDTADKRPFANWYLAVQIKACLSLGFDHVHEILYFVCLF